MNWSRTSSRPRKAVTAPVGSVSAARATGRPHRSDDPLMRRMTAALAMAAAVRPTSSTTMRSCGRAVSAVTSSMSHVDVVLRWSTVLCPGPAGGRFEVTALEVRPVALRS